MTYYINADTGNDTTGDGSSSNPWLTLAYAHNQASSGDTIICQDSTATYDFSSLTFTKDLTIQGQQDDASGAVFDANNTILYYVLDNQTIVFEKITFRNAHALAQQYPIFRLGYFNGDSTTVTCRNCIFKNMMLKGDVTIPQRSGVFGSRSNNSFSHILVIDTCLFNNIYKDPSISGDVQIFTSTSSGSAVKQLSILNSVIYHKETGTKAVSGIFGFYVSDSLNDLTIKNSIFRSSGDAIAYLDGATPNGTISISYSDFNNITSPPTGAGVITDDPLFVDEDNDNFNLRPTSPCIDTGVLV